MPDNHVSERERILLECKFYTPLFPSFETNPLARFTYERVGTTERSGWCGLPCVRLTSFRRSQGAVCELFGSVVNWPLTWRELGDFVAEQWWVQWTREALFKCDRIISLGLTFSIRTAKLAFRNYGVRSRPLVRDNMGGRTNAAKVGNYGWLQQK